MPDAGTSTEPTPEERRAAAVERMVIATNKLKAAVLATREAEDREAAAAAKVAKIEAATSLSRAAIVAEEQLQSADGASNHEGAAEALHGDAGIFEADTVSSMDIEAFKEHLRKQMSDNMGGVFISAEAPRSWNWGLCSMNHHHHIQLQALNASGRRERAPRRPVVRLRPLQGGGLQGACGVAIIRAWHLPEGHHARPWSPHDLPYTCASNLLHRAQAGRDRPQHMWRKQRSKSCCTNGDHLCHVNA